MQKGKKVVATCDSDIEPDNLIPEYIATKKKQLELERNLEHPNHGHSERDLAVAKVEARLARIENDVLFDKFLAEQQWKQQKVTVEKEIAAAKLQNKDIEEDGNPPQANDTQQTDGDEVNEEAQRIAAEILDEDGGDEDGLEGLFASLPQNEVDESTGKARTVVTSSEGNKIVIRDFGKWSGVSPQRALEEACRARYSKPIISLEYQN